MRDELVEIYDTLEECDYDYCTDNLVEVVDDLRGESVHIRFETDDRGSLSIDVERVGVHPKKYSIDAHDEGGKSIYREDEIRIYDLHYYMEVALAKIDSYMHVGDDRTKRLVEFLDDVRQELFDINGFKCGDVYELGEGAACAGGYVRDDMTACSFTLVAGFDEHVRNYVVYVNVIDGKPVEKIKSDIDDTDVTAIAVTIRDRFENMER